MAPVFGVTGKGPGPLRRSLITVCRLGRVYKYSTYTCKPSLGIVLTQGTLLFHVSYSQLRIAAIEREL